jgi:hypothetical protein
VSARGPGAAAHSYSRPDAAGRSYSGSWRLLHAARAPRRRGPRRPTVEASVRARLLTLPGATVVHTGHVQDTTTAAERPNLPTA